MLLSIGWRYDLGVPKRVFTFRQTSSAIISEFYNKLKDSDTQMEKLKFIETATPFIKSDLKQWFNQRIWARVPAKYLVLTR